MKGFDINEWKEKLLNQNVAPLPIHLLCKLIKSETKEDVVKIIEEWMNYEYSEKCPVNFNKNWTNM
jgi:hypothetical protein